MKEIKTNVPRFECGAFIFIRNAEGFFSLCIQVEVRIKISIRVEVMVRIKVRIGINLFL